MLSAVILSALFFGVDGVEAARRSSKRSASSQSSRGRRSKRSASSQRVTTSVQREIPQEENVMDSATLVQGSGTTELLKQLIARFDKLEENFNQRFVTLENKISSQPTQTQVVNAASSEAKVAVSNVDPMITKIENATWDGSKVKEVSLTGSGTLGIGLYKVVVAGAAGGKSAESGVLLKWCSGNDGGNGDVKTQVFRITSGEMNYNASWGSRPSMPGRPAACKTGSNGGNGPRSTFVIDGIVNITAEGGEGGIAYSGNCKVSKCQGGRIGNSSGSGQNAGNGYVRLYKAIL